MNNIVNGLYPRVSLSFARFAVARLIVFTRNLISMITKKPSLPGASAEHG